MGKIPKTQSKGPKTRPPWPADDDPLNWVHGGREQELMRRKRRQMKFGRELYKDFEQDKTHAAVKAAEEKAKAYAVLAAKTAEERKIMIARIEKAAQDREAESNEAAKHLYGNDDDLAKREVAVSPMLQFGLGGKRRRKRTKKRKRKSKKRTKKRKRKSKKRRKTKRKRNNKRKKRKTRKRR